MKLNGIKAMLARLDLDITADHRDGNPDAAKTLALHHAWHCLATAVHRVESGAAPVWLAWLEAMLAVPELRDVWLESPSAPRERAGTGLE